ncbi:hypothetical protein [Brevibacillus sp. NRS-1366]|uniref:hypothetical protein n=1 Tax=Brevibacillus sp. NRS-1366 TaxID=3233899 RepID=UPI003D23DE09
MNKAFMLIMAMVVVVCSSGCSSGTVSNEEKAVAAHPKEETNQTGTIEPTPHPEEMSRSASYNIISGYMEEECKKAFSPYYELLDFVISDYQETVVDGKVEATFGYKVIHKNFAKDPDTVGYIKAAKEKGDPNYQKLYDEYLQPKEMNFQLKAVIEDSYSIALYTNVNPKGIQWEKAVISDFVLSK